ADEHSEGRPPGAGTNDGDPRTRRLPDWRHFLGRCPPPARRPGLAGRLPPAPLPPVPLPPVLPLFGSPLLAGRRAPGTVVARPVAPRAARRRGSRTDSRSRKISRIGVPWYPNDSRSWFSRYRR